MTHFLLSLTFVLLFSLATAEEETPCYDWDVYIQQLNDTCNYCKQDRDVHMCIYRLWELTDEDDNVLASKIRAVYLEGLIETKIEAVREALIDCGNMTEKMTDKKIIHSVWDCADKALVEVCPEMKQNIEIMYQDPDLRACFYKYDPAIYSGASSTL